MKIVFLRKALLKESDLREAGKRYMEKLDYFKKGILRHLRSLKEETLDEMPDEIKKAYAPGTIRTWKGQKYIKGADKKWRRYYESASRGAQTSIKYLMKKVDAIQSVEGLLQLVLLHRDRFVDANGNPIPIVQELSRYVDARQGKINEPKPVTVKPAQAATPAPDTGKVDRSKLAIGDHYVAEADSVSGGEGKFVVRTLRKDGNDGYVSAIGQLGFGGIKKFNTREEAEQWIKDNPVKIKKPAPEKKPNERIAEIDGIIKEYQKDLQQTQENLEAWKKQGKASQVKDSQKAIKKLESMIAELKNEKAQLQPGKSESEKHRNRSEAMKGNDNAKKDGPEEIAASRQMKIEQKEEKEARKKAGMPETELFDRSSAMEDSTWDPKSQNYRYKDTGYIAGSRKENAASYIKHQAKNGTHVKETDIDWQGIEENPRQAKQLITKSNIFGKVDWNSLKESGMTGSAGFLVDRVYASVGAEPTEDNANARHRYSIAIDGLRDRLEKCKTVDEVIATIKEIQAEMKGDFVAARQAPEVIALSQKISELTKKKRELEKGERAIFGGEIYGVKAEKTELDKKADAYFEQEAEKVKAKDKRKKRVSEYDFSPEVRAEYNRLRNEATNEKIDRRDEYREKNGYLDDEKFYDSKGGYSGFKARGYLYNEIKALELERDLLYGANAAKIIMNNPLHEAWTQLGDKFQGVLNYGYYKGSDTFHGHVSDARRGKYDNWEWATKEIKAGTKGQKRKADFELKVASRLDRKGGRSVKSQTTLELKNNFNLRDVQSGNWVLNDPESAKFHVDNITAGLADLCDMTGIPDNMAAMNGRLAIAIGARGAGSAGWKKAAAAHYESVERVINLTKMKGGGSLAHEWFHAFDNLISEAMTGGDINQFLTDPYSELTGKQLKLLREVERVKAIRDRNKGSPYPELAYKQAVKAAEEAGVRIPEPGSEEEHIQKVKAAFNNLVKTMTEGTSPLITKISYNSEDYRKAQVNFRKGTLVDAPSKFAQSIRDAGSLEKAAEIINARDISNKKEWLRMAAAYYDGDPNGNTILAPDGRQGSSFLKEAIILDGGGGKDYFSTHKEMAARAFSAFVDDKLRKNDRLNDYLAYATTNDFYEDPLWGNSYPYPEGEERERINAAFEELFNVIKETGAIRKAIEMENTRIVLKKTISTKAIADDEKKLAYFKKQILACLDENNEVDLDEKEGIKKAGYPVGTVRTWKGQEYVKRGPGDWRPKYNEQTRGAKMAIAAIKKKVDAAKTAKELMDIVMKNRDRFSDKQGNPLPFVQELSKYVAERQDNLPENIKAKRKEARSNAIKAGQKKAREKKEEAKKAAEENKQQKAEKMKAQEGKTEDNKAKSSGEWKNPIEGLSDTPAFIVAGTASHLFNELSKEQIEKGKADREKVYRQYGWSDRAIDAFENYLGNMTKADDRKAKQYRDDNHNEEAYEKYASEAYKQADEKTYIESHPNSKPGEISDKIKTILQQFPAIAEDYKNGEISYLQWRAKLKVQGKYSDSEIAEIAHHLYNQKEAEKPASGDSQDDIDFQSIKEKYQGGKNIEGNEDEIYVGDEAMKGKWKLVEADSPSASHDEETFQQTRGFPKNKDGSTINDRDYAKDRAAQETVISIASNFDGRALSFDSPVVVTQDGVVVSGNNRTMSSKLAARKGSDTRYIDALRKRAERFGFKAEDIDGFKHPRVVFEIDSGGQYSTKDFAKYNQESQKTMSPLESAVKVSKIITEDTVKNIAGHITEFETMGELYADKKACTSIFNSLQNGKIINEFSRNTYIDPDGYITGAGKEFLETALIGSVVNEQNIRALNREGCKHIRAKLVRAITPLVNNKSLGGYSIMDELNQAIDISVQFNAGKKFGTLDDLVKQENMFEQMSTVAVELARKLQLNQKDFAEFMQTMNASLEVGASGQSDIFLGDVETKDDVLKRMLSIKKALRNVLNFFKKAGPKIDDKTIDLLKTDIKTVAIDFDGVINSYTGWKGPTVTEDPVSNAVESLDTLLGQGYKVVIYSTRAQTAEGLQTIREYLLKHSGSPAMVEGIEITDKKPIAHVYIDDRAITFKGDWEETLKQIEEFKPWMEKSLTWSGHKLQGRTKIQGMDISIENLKDSVRKGTDKDGHDWSIKMKFDYGYIRGTVGRDKDHLDCYIGPAPDSERVFIVHQNDPVTGKYDEDKVMLGFETPEAAEKAYKSQYDRPGFFGSMEEMNIDTFKEKVFDENNKGKMVT